MGSARPRPKRLAEKLLQIRQTLGLSQREIVKRLGFEGRTPYTNISKYEHDVNEPPLDILLGYARLAGVHVDVLIDDKLDLPKRLTSARRNDVHKL
jgi:transcriptional regulator with XRE-family HTH domain